MAINLHSFTRRVKHPCKFILMKSKLANLPRTNQKNNRLSQIQQI